MEESADLSEYDLVRKKLVDAVNFYLRSKQPKKRSEAIERLKLWDTVHGYTHWDKGGYDVLGVKNES